MILMRDSGTEIPFGHLFRRFTEIIDRSQQLPADNGRNGSTGEDTCQQQHRNGPDNMKPPHIDQP
ncbi:hypothetical protein D3C85_1737670 [compost metagenome]